MGVSEAHRRQRLLDLLAAAVEHKISSANLGALGMRTWALTRRASQDYIDDLVSMGYLILRQDGACEVTRLGHRAILDLPAPVPAPTIKASEVPLPPPHDGPPTPSPPIITTGGEKMDNHDRKTDG